MGRGRRPFAALPKWCGPSIALVLAGVLGGLGYGLYAPATYTADAFVLVVDDVGPDRAGPAALSFAQLYGRLAPLEETLRYSQLPLPDAPPGSTREHVRASTSPDTPVIKLAGNGRTPRDAAAFANGAADALVRYGTSHRADTGVRVALMGRAAPPATPSSPNLPLGVAVGAASGVLLAGLSAAVLSARRRPDDGADVRDASGPGTAVPGGRRAERVEVGS
ncbi:lipopolysaccharide biosynthesis protein [Actinomadura sp. KC06]|uniref:lipopolysaccharide biosynthesis protein n=1 Tax=Actinomadura sp. KC06 TaxID=2530369 RepID=UPI0010512651|nr:lipopolysaccharide biosynthesis protein [Actinomadura sp. KC06]TDD27447.1 lipopolysaccharide biosynthesis protein [Actinomadura sp. KC06]